MTFGRELVVLLAKPSMLGKLLVHVWRSCGGLNKAMIEENWQLVTNEPVEFEK